MYSSGEVKAQWRSALESAPFPLPHLSTPSWTDCTSDLPPGAAERSFSQKAAIPADGRDGNWRAFSTSDRLPPVLNVF
ncbi:unnamed protein product [Sphagnum balticum]